jgi:hypothetical protein
MIRCCALAFLLVFALGDVSADGSQARDEIACPGTNRAVAMSGGGIRGAYQVGALWHLVNVLDCDFQLYLGTSTGAVNAAILAQAANKEDLKRQIKVLHEFYAKIESASKILGDHFLGEFRFFLPTWLGGVDGTASLKPLEDELRKHIGKKSFRLDNLGLDKLVIPVVSLQSGQLKAYIHEPADLVDLVIGSSSIPYKIEPHRAKFWVHARPEALNEDILTLSGFAVPGIPDPNCQLRVDSHYLLCEHVGMKIVDIRPGQCRSVSRIALCDDYIHVSVNIKLPVLSLNEKELI